tara:strand:- start:232 stop:528 length:297 start_codon:yes stop_codon:yes gene_type:complete
MITLSVVLFLSLVVNAILIWYCRRLTAQFLFFSEQIMSLEASLVAFENHLKGVHELEMFYGDDTLGGLIEHSKTITTAVRDFFDGFSLEEEEEDDGDT